MRRHPSVTTSASPSHAGSAPRGETPQLNTAVKGDWGTVAKLMPYLWHYRWRVSLALGFMLAAKLANVGVPLLLKELVDSLSLKPGSPESMLVVPVGLLLAYGLLRLSTSLFTELRELVFACLLYTSDAADD